MELFWIVRDVVFWILIFRRVAYQTVLFGWRLDPTNLDPK